MRFGAGDAGRTESGRRPTRRVALPAACSCGRPAWPLAGSGARDAGGGGWLPGPGDRPEDGLASLGHEMQRPEGLWHLPAPLHAGRGRERRAIGRDPAEEPGARRQGRCESSEQRPDVLVGGSVSPDVVAAAWVAAIIDGGAPTAGASRERIGGDIARTICPGPVKAGRGQARRGLVFPQPRPRAGGWQRVQRRDGRARGAHAPGGRARPPRLRAVPPAHSRDGDTASQGGRERSGPPERPCGTASRRAAQTCPREPADTTGREAPRRAASAGLACPDRPGHHTADTRGACRDDEQRRSLAVARGQARSSLRWDRVETPPDHTWLCPPSTSSSKWPKVSGQRERFPPSDRRRPALTRWT